MPAFDGANPHPIYLLMLIVVFGAIFGGWMFLMVRMQNRDKQTAQDGPTTDRVERPRMHETRTAYTITPAAPLTSPAEAPAEPTGPPVLPFQTVLQYIGPRCIHLLIVGETHSGKSTSARAVLAGRIQAGDQIAILDPHGNPTNWGGIRAIGAGRDFAAIERAMVELLAEMTRRYKLLAEDASYAPPALSIFVDEWPAIQTACKKAAGQFITELAQEGRKVGMRLVMLTQSDLVASLGIEGKGDIRSNFTMLLLGGKASARADVSGLTWPAALRKGEGVAYPAITDPMPSYEAMLDTAAAAIWRPAAVSPMGDKPTSPAAPTAAEPDPDLDPLWAKFLNGESLLEPETGTGDEPATDRNPAQNIEKPTSSPVPENSVSGHTSVVFTGDEAPIQTVTSDLPMDDTSVAIRGMIGAGLSRSKVIQLLSLPGQRAAQFARIKQALGESEGGAQ